jgi:hypothetical protein
LAAGGPGHIPRPIRLSPAKPPTGLIVFSARPSRPDERLADETVEEPEHRNRQERQRQIARNERDGEADACRDDDAVSSARRPQRITPWNRMERLSQLNGAGAT